VIHDWPDAEAIRILRNCREALKPGGRVLIAETIVSAGNDTEPIKFIDVQMLVVTGGRNVQNSTPPFSSMQGCGLIA